tara:strand:+ start:34582 stop:35613 length:1032 start_codon:yes stop_codon:yes gene_type:complete
MNKPCTIITNNFNNFDLMSDSEDNFEEVVEVFVEGAFIDKRLDVVLSSLYPKFSRSHLKKWILDGNVFVNGNLKKPSYISRIGEKIVVIPPKVVSPEEWIPQKLDLDVVREDDHVMIINKRPGVVMHPGTGNHDGTILNGLIYHNPNQQTLPRAGLIHRLDKDTSGLFIVAKNRESYAGLVNQLALRQIKRNYLAISWGKLKAHSIIVKHLARNPSNRQKFCVSTSRNSKFAKTEIFLVGLGCLDNINVSLIKCTLDTGRTHQIRVHLEDESLPIIGDKIYKRGVPKIKNGFNLIQRQALHAYSISFSHPHSKKTISFDVPLPEDMGQLLKNAQINVENPEHS